MLRAGRTAKLHGRDMYSPLPHGMGYMRSLASEPCDAPREPLALYTVFCDGNAPCRVVVEPPSIVLISDDRMDLIVRRKIQHNDE